MHPIEFREANTTYAKNQPEYIPLPAWRDERETISCWKLSLKERIILFFTGRLWIRQLNFSDPLQAQLPQVVNPFEEVRDGD